MEYLVAMRRLLNVYLFYYAFWYIHAHLGCDLAYLAEWTEKGSGLLAHKLAFFPRLSWLLLTVDYCYLKSSIDAGIKLRPTVKDLEELGPSFGKLWEKFFVGAPDKPVAILCSCAG